MAEPRPLRQHAGKPAHDGRLCRKCGAEPARQRKRKGAWVYDWGQLCTNAVGDRTGSRARTRKGAAARVGKWGGNTYASISPSEWCALYAAQDGKCACCQRLLIDRYHREAAALDAEVAQLDHCHAIEAQLLADGVDPLDALRRSIRGLLCRQCNRITLPRLGHNADFAQRIADHLRNFVGQRFVAQEAPDGIRSGTGSVPPRLA